MIEDVLRTFGIRSSKIFLPAIIGSLTKGDMTFQGKPVACAWDAPVVR